MFDKAKEGVKKFINGIKNAMKKIGNAIKFFATPIGYVVGWLLIILICVFLLLTIFKYVATVFSELVGDYPDYTTFEDDVGYIQDLISSGYEKTINAENFQNFKSFEYAVLMDVAEYLRQSGEVMTPIDVAYETNQALIAETDHPQDTLDELVEKGIKSRSLKVEEEVPSIKKQGFETGGNTKVTPPTLVYEFKKGSIYSYSGDVEAGLMNTEKDEDEEDKTAQESLTDGSTLDGSAEQLLQEGKLKGSLYPYIYIVREDIDFTYFFSDKNSDEKKRVIDYKYELNVNNPYMTGSGTEFLKDIKIYNEENPDDELGIVSPGQSYTEKVYYTDVTTPVVYKIPLITLMGRYMPKLELLLAWTTLKQDVDKEGSIEMDDLVDEIIACIKGVYNEACLEGEEFETVKGENSGEIAYYSDATTHNKTFATFETAGIEKTLYGINGLKEAESGEIKVFTDCVAATIIEDKSITAEISYLDGTFDRKSYRLADLVSSSWKEHGYVIAEEAGDGGYIAPSSFESSGICAVGKSTSEVIATLKDTIIERLNSSGDVVKEIRIDDVRTAIKVGAAFAYEEKTPTHTLDVEHSRMPILLVKSVTTWARQINYVHKLTQNGFDSSSKWYIIPNSVSSMGLVNFQTTLKNEKTYRGAAYTKIFARMKEKDVLDILLQLEEDALAGSNDCYEYMRDVYRLLEASKEYSVNNPSADSNQNINPETYNYLYIPDSVLYYNDTLTQKIYWIDLFTAVMPTDFITADELKNVRTKRNNLTWQVVDYENYDECNETGKTLVYAINPFASSYLRAYYEASYQNGGFNGNSEINGSFGSYGNTDHSGADWGGRKRISNIYAAKSSAAVDDENPEISSAVYKYELNRLTNIYGETRAKEKIDAELLAEKTNLPIVAVAPGIVESVTYSARSGIYVKIKHTVDGASEDVYTYYMHLKRWPLVEEGDCVGVGTLLGYEGETGRAFGSHLHFQIEKGGVISPCERIYPSFNPFYNDGFAKDDGYSLSSEYMSLYRTVTMTEDGKGVTNQHPIEPLVDNFENLLQNQGEFDKTKVSMSGDLGWNASGSIISPEKYIDHLKNKKYYDLYIKKAYKDYNLAKEGGYLDVPTWLWDVLGEMDYIVNTEMPGSLPALAREELVYILENWLPARYGESKIGFGKGNGKVKKVDWLMQNVFTDETIDKIIEYQDQYHVSAVFALAVATIEQNMGLSGTDLALKPACNIFSIKGGINGGIRYQNGKLWNKYLSYGNAFQGFDRLISERGPYFKSGKYTIMTIAPTYCNVKWGNSVSKISSDIMKYYIGNWETQFGDFMLSEGNDEFAKAAENCMNWLNKFKNNFKYGSGVKVPPYKGDFGAPNSSDMDCSGYVSWVIHEYGKANSTDALDQIGRWTTVNFKALGDAIMKGKDYRGVAKYFEIVATRTDMPGGNIKKVADRLQAGDIILYKEGSGHHVEILKETGDTKVYTCGSASGWKNPGAQSYTRRSDVTYIFRLKKGVQ